MSKSRLGRNLWIEALHKFLNGKNLTELALEYGFKVPHFNTFTTDISSKAFRYRWKGVCTPCKRIITKENRLNAKSK